MQRIVLKRKRPNLLFETWLEEWRERADEKMKINFSKALASLQKYPLPLKAGQDCMVLQNFGSKLCMMLDKRLELHHQIFSTPVATKKKVAPKRAIKKLPVLVESDPAINLSPTTFDIILLVDNNEKTDGTVDELTRLDVAFEVRHLNVGDFEWVARCRSSKRELILPYIIERKRLDDLGASIKDGRFHEQKFRLKQSGIENIIYLVENQGNDNKHTSLPISTLLQASTNSLVQEGFTLKFTKNHKDSMAYLSRLTKALDRKYQDKFLIETDKENLVPSSPLADRLTLMEFEKFNKTSSKIKTYTVKELFIRQLLQLKGLSLDRVLAIIEHYPTPYLLREAFLNAGYSGDAILSSLTFGRLNRKFGLALSRTLYQLYTSRVLK